MRSTRVAGHGLIGEGAPHDDNGQRISTWRMGTGGHGRGKCICGAMSEPLTSQPARRQWHDQHKSDMAEARIAASHAVASALNDAIGGARVIPPTRSPGPATQTAQAAEPERRKP